MMPIKQCKIDGLNGFKWGENGKCHTFPDGDDELEAQAEAQAIADGEAESAEPAEMSTVTSGGGSICMSAPVNVDGDGEGDLHIMRLGPLYDLSDGKLVIDLTEELAQQIAENTQRMIAEGGHFLPISFEHGIEASHRGQPGDPKPYGMIKRVYYKPGKGIYAEKQWSAVGVELVSSSMMDDGTTALRVSPRVNSGEAYHPDTGELMGKGYIDVVSLTTLPRQNNMMPVAMSRAADEGLPKGDPVEMIDKGNQTTARAEIDGAGEKSEGVEMAKTNQEPAKTINPNDDNGVVIVLSRGSNEQVELFRLAGIDEDAEISEVIERVAAMSKTNEDQAAELGRYRAQEKERQHAERVAAVDVLLDKHTFDGEKERGFYASVLLGDDQQAAELARVTLEEKIAVDPMIAVNEAITNAKKLGALPADFSLDEDTAELARANPDVVIAVIGQHGAGSVVNVGEAAGDDAAGLDGGGEIDRDEAGKELSREAHKIYNERNAGGNVISLSKAHELAREARPELSNAIYGNGVNQ